MTQNKRPLDVEGLETALDAVEPNPDDAIDATVLRELRALVQARSALDTQIIAAVTSAREAGLSWGFVARALGVTRQAARQKYDLLITRRT